VDVSEHDVADRPAGHRANRRVQLLAFGRAAAVIDHHDRFVADDEADIGDGVVVLVGRVLMDALAHEDARLAVEAGLDGIVVSNHGGRAEDNGRSTIDALPEILEAVAGRAPVLIDGGFRRGTDIVKALALGARAVCIGRPYLWGLGAFGQAGVEQVLAILRRETFAAMQQLGAPSLKDLVPAMVRRA